MGCNFLNMRKIFFVVFLFLTAFINAQTYFMPIPYTKLDQVWGNRSVPTGQNLDSTWKALVQYTINQIGPSGGLTAGYIPYWNGTALANSYMHQTHNTVIFSGGGLFNAFTEYSANYGQSYTARSLTDKNYVDSSLTANPSGWRLTGNSGTTPGTNFVGTTDANLIFKNKNSITLELLGSNVVVPTGKKIAGIDTTTCQIDMKYGGTAKAMVLSNDAGAELNSFLQISNRVWSGQATSRTGNVVSTNCYASDNSAPYYQVAISGNVKGSNYIQYDSLAYFTGSVSNDAIKIGIGTSTPSTSLHVYSPSSPAFRLVDGTQSNGYILTSDANGNASWAVNAGATSDWSITGNSGTTAGTNFIGTTDAIALVFKTNNTEAFRILSAGNIQINSGHTLTSSSGGGLLDLRYGAVDGNVLLSSHASALDQSTVELSTNSGALVWNATGGGATVSVDVNGIHNTGTGTTFLTQPLQYTGATPTNGYVLTSDGSGNATWTNGGISTGSQYQAAYYDVTNKIKGNTAVFIYDTCRDLSSGYGNGYPSGFQSIFGTLPASAAATSSTRAGHVMFVSIPPSPNSGNAYVGSEIQLSDSSTGSATRQYASVVFCKTKNTNNSSGLGSGGKWGLTRPQGFGYAAIGSAAVSCGHSTTGVNVGIDGRADSSQYANCGVNGTSYGRNSAQSMNFGVVGTAVLGLNHVGVIGRTDTVNPFINVNAAIIGEIGTSSDYALYLQKSNNGTSLFNVASTGATTITTTGVNSQNLVVTGTSANTWIDINNTASGGLDFSLGSTSGAAGIPSVFNLRDNTNGGLTRISVDGSGNVGLGGTITTGQGAGAMLYIPASGTIAVNEQINFVSANVGIGSASPTQKLDVNGSVNIATSVFCPLHIGSTGVGSSAEIRSTSGVGTTDYIKFTTGNNGATEAMRILHNGNVGIGSASPTQKLDVVGNVQFSGALMPNSTAGTSGQVLTSAGAGSPPTWGASLASSSWELLGNSSTVDGTNFIGNTDNIPFTIRVNNIQSCRLDATNFNTYLGYQAGNTAASGDNTGLGADALNSVTTGLHNTAPGALSLFSNTIGSGNTGNGYASLNSNVTGSSNTAIGTYSGEANTSGSWNTFVGDSAGISNTTGKKNTYLGTYANGSATLTNACAIGYNASVTASNAMSLGNGMNVGIGSTAPAYPLDVVGAVNSSTNLITQLGFSAVPQYTTPATGATVVANSGVYQLICNPSGSLLTLTVDFPASPINGQRFQLAISQIITTLTLATTDGSTIDGTIATSAINSYGAWSYVSSVTTWFKVD